MKSRLLSRLEADIRSAADPLAADCLRCERAAYLARLGEVEEATRELAALRQCYGPNPQPALSAWVHLADGLIGHYTNLAPGARDKLARAHALSAAAGLKPLQALSAAWLAHFEYLRLDVAALARRAGEALSLARPDHHAAQARARLVVAQSYHEGGRYDLARPWYDQARHHATTEGDDATLSAMLWNIASLHVAAARQLEAAGSPVDAQARLSAESTGHFDAMLGVRSLRALQPILRAQAYTVLGRTDEALALFDAHLAEALDQGMREVEGVLLADRAWCRLRAGHLPGARGDAGAALACLAIPGSHCDRAPGHSRLAQVYVVLGETDAAMRQRELAVQAWAGHAADQSRLIEALQHLEV